MFCAGIWSVFARGFGGRNGFHIIRSCLFSEWTLSVTFSQSGLVAVTLVGVKEEGLRLEPG